MKVAIRAGAAALVLSIVTLPAPAVAETPEERWHRAVIQIAETANVSVEDATRWLIAVLNPRYVHPNPNVDQWFDTALAAGWPREMWRWQSCIINRESGGQAGVRSRTRDTGLMQINDVNVGFLRGKGIIASRWDLFDPLTNLAAAKALYDLSGTSPWRATRSRC